MIRNCRLTLAVLICAMASASVAGADSITYRASGEITDVDVVPRVCDPDGTCPPWPDLSPVYVGMPWQLDVTFDPDTPGTPFGSIGDSFFYYGLERAVFELGDFSYTATYLGGFTFVGVNMYWPLGNVVPGSGLVQFHIQSTWVSDDGGPTLSPGLMVASWYDENALDGSLPGVPELMDTPGNFFWIYSPDTGLPAFFSDRFRPELVEDPAPVPEPSSLLLLGAGGVAVAVKRLRKRA